MGKTFNRIPSEEIHEGVKFSAPLFFDDGENMFLAEGKEAKTYHMAAIKRWGLKSFLTYGHELTAAEIAAINEKKVISSRLQSGASIDASDFVGLEELEEL